MVYSKSTKNVLVNVLIVCKLLQYEQKKAASLFDSYQRTTSSVLRISAHFKHVRSKVFFNETP